MTEQITVDRANMIHTSSHSKEIDSESLVHNLVNPLRRDRNLDSTLRNFLIRSINKKAYPNRKRVTIEIEPWGSTPVLFKIDSHAKHCIACGNHAYYVSYFVYNKSCKLAWRKCWKCLNNEDRESLIDYYTINNSELK